jgi:hypothetical protein
VSVFRPAARVTTPDGREWEIFAYKIKLRDREPWEGPDDPELLVPGDGVGWFLGGALWLLLLVPRLLLRLVDLVSGALRAVRSNEWTIDIVTHSPPQTAYRWTTTTEFKGQVLAQVEGTLARGDLPQRVSNAVYRGEDRRSAR